MGRISVKTVKYAIGGIAFSLLFLFTREFFTTTLSLGKGWGTLIAGLIWGFILFVLINVLQKVAEQNKK